MSHFFVNAPLYAIYVFTCLLVLLSLGVGTLLGQRRARLTGDNKDASLGSAVAATLGLLAFLLAFTFNMTADRYVKRKALLLDEVNAIGTTYLRADFLTENGKDRAKKLLAEYAAVRDFIPGKFVDNSVSIARSESIQSELWQIVNEHIKQNYKAVYLREFVEPLNQVIDYHYSRVAVGLSYRIPTPIWIALYFMTVLAMLGIGFQLGVSSGGSLAVGLGLALTFSTAILLISDLDRSSEGTLIVDQTPMTQLNRHLQQVESLRNGANPPD